ncbi:site-specific integrase [Pseudonocardia nigra]|uniref:site-specific integrase n=1 Tax=Pseudonocardia nigra TaxID=1921578 RepID=UPI001FE45825|nr:tyrosine-type recombinase/integrase [Pseudonocardia nigra]
MGRPPLPIGTYGKIRTYPLASGAGFRATTMFRDNDGRTRPVERRGKSAAAAVRELKKALKDRTGPAAGEITGDTRVKVLAGLYLAEVRRRRQGTTYDTYALHMRNHVLPAFGEMRAREVTVSRVDAFLRTCERTLSANTVRSVRTVISGTLAHAARLGAIPSNPVRDAGPMESTRKEVRALTAEERADLLGKLDADDIAQSHDLPDLVVFLLGTGCRIGETIAAQVGAIDWDAATITIAANIVRVRGAGLVRHDGKTFSSRRVLPLPGFLVKLLINRGLRDAPADAMIFPNTQGGWRDPHNTGGRLREAFARAGYGWVTSHVFRKTAITVLDHAGLTARAIAGHSGHARPSITQDVYMDKRAEGRQAADALDDAMGSMRRGV